MTKKTNKKGRPQKFREGSPVARRIAAMYRLGLHVADIANRFKLSRDTVRRIALREGCDKRPVGRPKGFSPVSDR